MFKPDTESKWAQHAPAPISECRPMASVIKRINALHLEPASKIKSKHSDKDKTHPFCKGSVKDAYKLHPLGCMCSSCMHDNKNHPFYCLCPFCKDSGKDANKKLHSLSCMCPSCTGENKDHPFFCLCPLCKVSDSGKASGKGSGKGK